MAVHLIKLYLFLFAVTPGLMTTMTMMLIRCTVSLLLAVTAAATVSTGSQNHSHHNHTRLHHIGHRLHRQRHLHNAVKSEVELLPGMSMPPISRGTDNTRLRRLHHAHHPYNKVLTRRLHQRPTEWDYNTYNIYTNTFGPPPPPVPPVSPYAGKGEDNTGDVEFIGVTGRGRGNEYVPPITTAAPPPNLNRRAVTPGLSMGTVPPLVPARRGYSYTTTAPSTTTTSTTNSPTTEDPYETNTISRNYPTDAKEMER